MIDQPNEGQSSKNEQCPPEFEAPEFEEELSLRLWENYFERVESELKSLWKGEDNYQGTVNDGGPLVRVASEEGRIRLRRP